MCEFEFSYLLGCLRNVCFLDVFGTYLGDGFEYYWSSTEYNNNNGFSWLRDFGIGYSGNGGKMAIIGFVQCVLFKYFDIGQ
jgi:hypothetical protein